MQVKATCPPEMLLRQPTEMSPSTEPPVTLSPLTGARIQLWLLWLQTFPESQEKTTQSMPRFQRLLSAVKVKLMEVTTLIQRLNVKHSTFVLLMELEVLPNTVSCVPMELCSTRTTSSVTGGSTLIVQLLRTSTASMMKLLLKEMLLLELQTNLSMELLQNTEQPLLQTHTQLIMIMETLVLVVMKMQDEQQGGSEQIEAVDEDVKDGEEADVDEPDFGFLLQSPKLG